MRPSVSRGQARSLQQGAWYNGCGTSPELFQPHMCHDACRCNLPWCDGLNEKCARLILLSDLHRCRPTPASSVCATRYRLGAPQEGGGLTWTQDTNCSCRRCIQTNQELRGLEVGGQRRAQVLGNWLLNSAPASSSRAAENPTTPARACCNSCRPFLMAPFTCEA